MHVRRLSYLRPLPRDRVNVAYVGWLGYGNVGDDALHDALQLAFPHWRLAHVSHERLLRPLTASPLARRLAGILVGGGTLIGHETFRRHVQLLGGGARKRGGAGIPAFALGTGVCDPAFPDRPTGVTAAELERWGPLLRRFEHVSVRGERSRELLATLGIDAEVVGDPALLLRPPIPRRPAVPPTLGVNIGVARTLWGMTAEGVLAAVAPAAADFARRGWRVELFPLWWKDLPLVEEAARRIGAGASVFRDFQDLGRLLCAMQDCEVIVGMKLHSVVLAAAAGVPAVMLEYHPKCREFQASVGREDFTLRTDALSPERIGELLTELADRREAHATDLARVVEDRRAALLRRVRAIVERVELA
jgi:polysaccharide pyruvyl transferase WcaK-like protein